MNTSMARKRWVVLAAGMPLVLAAIAVSSAALVHAAARTMLNLRQVGYSVALSVPVTGREIHVTSNNGNMAVRAGSGRDIAVRGDLVGSMERPVFTHQLTSAGLSLNSWCRVPVGDCSAGYAVTVPARPQVVNLGSSFGDLTATGLTGTVTLSDGSGNLGGSRLRGDIRMADNFGTISASDLSGSIDLNNSSGDIDASGLTGDTKLEDSFGTISVSGISAADVHATNQSGDITLVFTAVPKQVIVTDSFGNITLQLPPGPARYTITAHAGFGVTSIHQVPQSPSAPNVITATNNSGNITIVERGGDRSAPSAPAGPSAP